MPEWFEFIKAIAPDVAKKLGDRLKKGAVSEFVKKSEGSDSVVVMKNGERIGVKWMTLAFPDEDLVVGFGQRIKEDSCTEEEAASA
jgi:hypothetical protein